MKKAFLLDGHSLIHRAYYAIPELKTKKGTVTNAAYGFSLMLIRLLQEKEPDYIAVAFDMEGPTFRHQRFHEYKATRDRAPEDLKPQLALIRKILTAFDIPIYEEGGYEADDVIGTMAQYFKEKGLYTVVVTGDRDALQLVNPQLEVMYTRRGITDIVTYDEKRVQEEYGVPPEMLVDLKGLMGDSSDNIPGVDGIGKATARDLINEFGSLIHVLENSSKVRGKKRQENLKKQRDRALLSQDLARIRTDVPLQLELTAMDRGRFDPENLSGIFQELEFKNILDRLGLSQQDEGEKPQIPVGKISSPQDRKDCFSRIKERGVLALELVEGEEPMIYLACGPKEVFCYQAKGLFLKDDPFLAALKEVLEDKAVEKYMMGAKEKILFLSALGIEVSPLTFEPSIAAYLINPGGRINTLGEIIQEYRVNGSPRELSLEEGLSSLFSLKEKMMNRIAAMDLESLYSQVELPLVRVLVEMERNGIMVDKQRLREISKDLGGRLLALRMEATSLVGQEFNLNSPQQLGKILFEDLKLPVLKKTKTGYSTAANVLEDLKNRHPVIPVILQYRQLMKLQSTYVDSLLELVDRETDRVHTSFNQLVTATGRLSSTEPNLQNIPIRTEEGRKIREAFVPGEPGWSLLTADYSQVELRVLAHISGDPGLKEAFEEGEDIHTNTAAQVFMVSKDLVSREERRRAKAINFGIAYGMSAFGLAQDLDISREEAQEYIHQYFLRYPGVKSFMNETIQQAKEVGCVRTLLGRTRFLPDIHSRNRQKRALAERMAINTPIQGSAADIIKLAMVEIYRFLKTGSFQGRLLLQVHDELVFEVPEKEIQDFARVIKEKMEGAVQLDVPLIVDVKKGLNWRDTKKLTV